MVWKGVKGITLVSLCCLVCVAMGLVIHNGAAQTATGPQLRQIGVVSMMTLLRDSQRAAERERQFNAEQERIKGELDKLNQELETDQSRLRAFRQGSQEYLDLYKGIMEKQARMQALQEYHRQAMTAKERQWTEQLYKEILQVVEKVAEQKGLSLVLEWTEPEFPIPAERFVATLNTQKVLYARGCVDITADVLAMIDQK